MTVVELRCATQHFGHDGIGGFEFFKHRQR
jgi:hypothetical protein